MQVLFAISVTANTAPTIYSCGLSSFVVFPFLAKGEQANVAGLCHPFLTYLLQCRGTSWPSRSLPYIFPSLYVSSFAEHPVEVTNCCLLHRSSVQITVCLLRSWIGLVALTLSCYLQSLSRLKTSWPFSPTGRQCIFHQTLSSRLLSEDRRPSLLILWRSGTMDRSCLSDTPPSRGCAV